MLISNSKKNPLEKNWFLEMPFAEIICKTLQQRNSRAPSVLSKMVSFVKIVSQIRNLCYFQVQSKILLKKAGLWKYHLQR